VLLVLPVLLCNCAHVFAHRAVTAYTFVHRPAFARCALFSYRQC
jgi:hypothetical protein